MDQNSFYSITIRELFSISALKTVFRANTNNIIIFWWNLPSAALKYIYIYITSIHRPVPESSLSSPIKQIKSVAAAPISRSIRFKDDDYKKVKTDQNNAYSHTDVYNIQLEKQLPYPKGTTEKDTFSGNKRNKPSTIHTKLEVPVQDNKRKTGLEYHVVNNIP